MTKTFASRLPAASAGATPALQCVWVETGLPRRPLACCWIRAGATGVAGPPPAGASELSRCA